MFVVVIGGGRWVGVRSVGEGIYIDIDSSRRYGGVCYGDKFGKGSGGGLYEE